MTPPNIVKVGSRRSPLSVAQTGEVLSELGKSFPLTTFQVVPITTDGDRRKDAPLGSLDRGVFAKEIEIALLQGQIDIAIHSAKDLTSDLPEGLVIGGIPTRLDPRDVLVNRWGFSMEELPNGARIGTSSPRRSAQIKALRPDVQVLPIRGNVGTRIEKVRGDDYDGVVLAAAGLLRLGRQAEITEYLCTDVFTPDVGQGALVIQIRVGEPEILDMLKVVNDPSSSFEVGIERAQYHHELVGRRTRCGKRRINDKRPIQPFVDVPLQWVRMAVIEVHTKRLGVGIHQTRK